MSRILLLLIIALTPFSALADGSIYRTTDEHGNVVFTDKPPADVKAAERVNMHRTNTTPPPEAAPAVTPASTPNSSSSEQPAAASVVITTPEDDTTIPNGPGDFSVAVKVKPALRDGQTVQLFLNGEPRGEPQRDTAWSLTGVFRGQHDLTVGIVDTSGHVLVMSEPVRVYVFRPSINFVRKRQAQAQQ